VTASLRGSAVTEMPEERRAPNARRFGWILASVAIGGLVIRISYVLIERKDIAFGGDAFFYHAGANLLSDGKGFISPFAYAQGRVIEAADHPPLYVIFLAIPSLLELRSVLNHLIWSCLLGTATIALVGYVGRQIANERAAIIAAVLAAIYPGFWAFDGSLQSETLSQFVTALVLLLAYRYWRRPNLRRLVGVGVACGAAALARSELVLLVPMLLVPLALLTPAVPLRRRVGWLGAGAVAAALVIAPWVGYNIERFRHPIYLSSQFDSLLASANCDSVYHGSATGYFSIPCAEAVDRRYHLTIAMDQSQQAIAYREAALEYVRHHTGRLPVVVAARVGRIAGVFQPSHQLAADAVVEGREVPVARAALFSFYAVALLSVAGVLLLRRRRTVPVFPLMSVLAVVVLTVAVTYGSTRFRAPAEVVLALLAAVALDAGISRLRATHRPQLAAGQQASSGAESTIRSGS
jgi:4-amino-4-deoxy-L-arabinose transferase-like glycosyltransferase